MIGIGFGAFFGLTFFGTKNAKLCHTDVEDELWWKPLARIGITSIICGVVMLPYLLLTGQTISNIYLLMIFKTLLPTFAAGFLLFCGLFEHIFRKLDILKIESVSMHPFGLYS